MKAELQQWLDDAGTYDWPERYGDAPPISNIGELYGLLCEFNGGPQVRGWGVFSGGFGLTQGEALLLLELTGQVEGMGVFCTDEEISELLDEVKRRGSALLSGGGDGT